jgi:transcriptional regulator with XRE-family HTH domain
MKDKKFAKDLRKIRKASGLTQKDLGKQVGAHGTTISGIEKRKFIPGANFFLKLCKALFLDPRKYWLYGGVVLTYLLTQ